MKFDAGTKSSTAAVKVNDTPRRVRVLELLARAGNAGNAYFGSSTNVSAASGFELTPGDTLSLDFANETEAGEKFCVIAPTSGDKVDWVMIFVR